MTGSLGLEEGNNLHNTLESQTPVPEKCRKGKFKT